MKTILKVIVKIYQSFLDVLEEELKHEKKKTENILTILVHPYLYGISYLNLNKVEYLQRYSRAVKSFFQI